MSQQVKRQNSDQLCRLEKMIRHHYFDDGCKHDNYQQCCTYMFHKTCEIINYKPRVPALIPQTVQGKCQT